MAIRFVLLLSLLCCASGLFAQRFGHNPNHALDSVKVKANRFIFIGDHAYYVKHDTVFMLPDSVEFHIKKNNMQRTEHFYENVEAKMSKTRVSSLMYDLLFKSAESEKKPHSEKSSEQRFTPFENHYIDTIKYKQLNVFGSKIKDTTVNREDRWTRPLNRIHMSTRPWVVRKNLLFKQGDKIDPNAMVDTERLLRRLDYVRDARVFVGDKKGKHSEIVVATKDVFPYNFEIYPNNGSDALFGISNINIAGIGHELEYDYIEDGGSEFFYRVRNIEDTFIDSEINVANHFERTGEGIYMSKQFLTQDTKYAGGFSWNKYDYGERSFDPINDTTTDLLYGQRYRDLWAAKSFNSSVISGLIGFEENTKVVASARVEYYDYYDRPLVNIDTNYRFYDKTNYLFSIGLTSRTYYKDQFILQYGRTEDIPTGSTLWMVLGHQSGEFKNRKYIGVNYARGGYVDHFGYLNTIYSLGSFISGHGFEDGVLKIGADYYTKLFTLNHYKFRQFVDVTLSQTIDPSGEVIMKSQNDLGIRGLSGVYLPTTSKFNVKMESLLFTPMNVLGFKLALFGFFDYTLASDRRNSFFGTQQFTGMGGGIRLRNDNLAFSTLQFWMGHYPKIPLHSSSSVFNISTTARLKIRDFHFRAPAVIKFN